MRDKHRFVPDLLRVDPESERGQLERLAAFKVPKRIIFWPQTLPRNANGKIMKNELKALFVEA